MEKDKALCLLKENIKEIRERHSKWTEMENRKHGMAVYSPKWLPSVFIKYGIKRVKNAERIRQVIQEEKLDLLDVPEKFVFRIYDTEEECNDSNSVTIASRIQWDEKYKYHFLATLEQVKQLCTLAMKGPHYDLIRKNMIPCDGKLFIIDMDEDAVPSEEEHKKRQLHWKENGNSNHPPGGGMRTNPNIINHPLIPMEILQYSKWEYYSGAAYEYLSKLIRKLEDERTDGKSPWYTNHKQYSKEEEEEKVPVSPPSSPRRYLLYGTWATTAMLAFLLWKKKYLFATK